MTAFAIARPQLQAGQIKLLAVTNTARAAVLPDLPTVTEAGYPEINVVPWYGYAVPRGTSTASHGLSKNWVALPRATTVSPR